jgi:hypothetical protein
MDGGLVGFSGMVPSVDDFRYVFAYRITMFDPDAGIPRPNRALTYFGACIIAGLRLARERQVPVQ